MPALKDMCQKCGLRPGTPWEGSGGFDCLCGPCKVKLVLVEDGLKPGYAVELPESWLCQCPRACSLHAGVDARFDTSEDYLDDERVN